MTPGENSVQLEERAIGLWLCTATPTDLAEEHFQHCGGLWRDLLQANSIEELTPYALRMAVTLMRENDFAHENFGACERTLKANLDLRTFDKKTSRLRGSRAGRRLF